MRFRSLDSLRGIAALVVVIHHCVSMAYGASFPAWIRFSPLRLLLDGKGSVLAFFALSGFVLFMALKRPGTCLHYGSFIAKRFMRLLPPFGFAIFASAALYSFVKPQPIPHMDSIFDNQWNSSPNWALI